ncbi:hypothetical protein ALC62_08203, partial [Cyphomyrmex costatus]
VALTPGPWIEQPTFPGLVTESPLTPGRYEVLDKQLARAHKDAFYTLEPRQYYVHHSRVYPRDVCTSSYASNAMRKREEETAEAEGGGVVKGGGGEARKRDKRARDGARKAPSRSTKRDNAYIDMPSVRQRFASSLPFRDDRERSGGGDPGMKKNDVERGDGGVRSTLSYLASATPPIDRPTVFGPDARSQLAEYRERDVVEPFIFVPSVCSTDREIVPLIPFKGEARRRNCNYEINKNRSISLLHLTSTMAISRRDGKGSIDLVSAEKHNNHASDFDPHGRALAVGGAENEVVFFPDNDDRATARSVSRR